MQTLFPSRGTPRILLGKCWLFSAPVLGFIVMLTGCAPEETALPEVAEHTRDGKVILGSPRLTAGIPGTGELTIPEIQRWLKDPVNHQALGFVLPWHLEEAADAVFVPKDNPLTRAKIELGRQLYFDTRLSNANVYSCSSCHLPEQSFAHHMVMPHVKRNPLPVVNRILSKAQFWDGKAKTLEEQPIIPIKTPYEMNTTPEKCADRVWQSEGYRLQFAAIFDDGKVTFENIAKALSAFERVLVSGASPWDYQRELDRFADQDPNALSKEDQRTWEQAAQGVKERPMSPSALRGMKLFFSDQTSCGDCHSGPNLTDEDYHNLGVGIEVREMIRDDQGRIRVTGREEDRYAFRTPTLRNASMTRPYMHDGSHDSLKKVVDFLAAGGKANPQLSPLIRPLDLTDQDKEDLVEFIKACDSPLPPVETERLPR
ncbi:MAG: cytochrome-c peroxidase [Planctomycetales bacterium]